MPDLDEQTPKKASQSITLEWLKDRNRSLPLDVTLDAQRISKKAPDRRGQELSWRMPFSLLLFEGLD
jgi:hypothetical protein